MSTPESRADLREMTVEQLAERAKEHMTKVRTSNGWIVVPRSGDAIDELLRRLSEMEREVLALRAFRAAAWQATRGEPLPEWVAGTVECLICGDSWLAVREDGTSRLECPNCGHMNDTGEPTP